MNSCGGLQLHMGTEWLEASIKSITSVAMEGFGGLQLNYYWFVCDNSLQSSMDLMSHILN